ncbi:eukaryotic translation initiation factor 4G [Prunus yedoensis var. nudiflora]|uniref:Eukaryotic translation initiation factor 4G n=1 Tax=Prunus yedoensis var. nudiflora TaxID=2094558 RepID=A0A314UH27_PRUYE|nr:eukaryotic translation initiation factor 4G [Prunus yedoensis var. nudiflora]
MSFNQSRSDKNETQYRKTGRSASSNQQHRGYSPAYPKGTAAGAGGPAPSISSNRSYKKNNNNAQGGQSRGSVTTVNPLDSGIASTQRGGVQNGAHVQPQLHGGSDALVATTAPRTTDASAPQRSTRTVPKAPTSQSASVTSDTRTPTTPAKIPGDASQGFAFQFGSISPGFMNGMQIPARTSSAPPNLDEQKRDQARHDSYRPVPSVPTPNIPKQQLPRKDPASMDQPNASEAHLVPKVKKDMQTSHAPPASQTQKPSALPMAGISMPMPFHQQQVSVQFGGPNQQIQSQGMSANSVQIPMPMPLPIGSNQVQQPVFVPGLQPHPMQHQGIMHQGPFTPQMGPQVPQLGSMGISLAPQYAQQQGGKFGGPRKTSVKITHPDTHEELRLDKRTDSYSDGGPSVPRTHPNVPPQSQPIQSFAPSHPSSYYANSYSGSLFFPASNSHPLTSSHMPPSSQAPRFSYPVSQGPQNVPFINPPAHNALPVNKAGPPMHNVVDPPNLEHARDIHNVPAAVPSATIPVVVKAAVGTVGEKVVDPVPNSSTAVEKGELPKPSKSSGEISQSHPQRYSELSTDGLMHSDQSILKSLPVTAKASAGNPAAVLIESQVSNPLSSASAAPTEESVPVVTTTEPRRKETLSRSNSIKDQLKKPGKKGNNQAQHQVVGQSISTSSTPSQASEHEPISIKPLEPVREAADSAVATSETAQGGQAQHESCHADFDGKDASSSRSDTMGSKEVAVSKCSKLDQQYAPVQTTEVSGITTTNEGINVENTGGGGGSIENIDSGGDPLTVSGSKDKPLPELSRQKSNTSKGKKKRREFLSKADAAGVTSDLYGAYKNPEEKKGIASPESTESTESTTGIVSKQVATDAPQQDAVGREEDAPSKAEPDDWEDAADISTPKLEASDNGEQVQGGGVHSEKDGHGHGAKKYSRDFLLKFSVQFTELPEGFEIMSDARRVTRLDRRGSGLIDDDRWNKGGAANFRAGQGVNFGVLRNPRPSTPVQQHVRGILPGPTQSVGPQGGMQRNNSDADRWQRASNFQPKGLMPYPHTPLQVMHKAERKYEVGKVSDEEQAKQRQLKAILNKLTPQNFDKLFEQVKAVNIDNATTLTGVISQIFDKALMEPTFCEMYANFCFYLAGELPDFSEDNEKITFKRLLLNKCQEEFERGEREQEEANKADEEGEVKQSEEEREEKRIKARRRMLGNIRLIGELYKKKMLTERIMHECIKKLLGQQQTPDEEDIEALCKLMSTIGEMIDHPKAKEHMDAYFERMKSLSNNMKLSSRVRFMLKDSIDLRKNKWQQRRKVEGPKKIEELHRDAAQERQAQASRLGRGPGMNPSARRTPMDFSPRGSTMLSSPNPQMGGFRGMPAQVRGYGSQDVRADERHSYEGRTLSVPLTQRPIGDDSITLGPQGGLARGMSIRGPPSMSAAPQAEISPSVGDSRRMTAGLNGFSSLSERPTYNPREEHMPRYLPDRFAGPAAYDQSNAPERNVNFGGRDPRNSDRSFDRSRPASPATRAHAPALTQNVPQEKVLTEDRLRDMSLAAIKEFYSARDEKEVALCIKELNSPSFHPSMISLWVTDSFERKDTERDLLAKLLVNLTKSHDGTLSQSQLIKGFETVLSTLEDAVNDAPKAPEFLGLIFAKVILENVVSLKQIGQIIYEGGEEPGHLLEVGLAGNVLGNILEIIKLEKGDSVFNEIRTASNLRLETFRPPDPLRSRILEKFI